MLHLKPLSSWLIPLLLVLVAPFVVRLCWLFIVRCVMVCHLVFKLVVSSVMMSLVVVVMV